MQSGRMQYLELELKYCERCGTLGLRRQGSSQVYCEGCEQEMAKVCLARSVSRREITREELTHGSGGEAKKKPCGSVKSVCLQESQNLSGGRWL